MRSFNELKNAEHARQYSKYYSLCSHRPLLKGYWRKLPVILAGYINGQEQPSPQLGRYNPSVQ